MRLLGEIRNYLGNYQLKSGVYHYDRREYAQAAGFLRKALGDDASLGEAERRTACAYLTRALKGQARKLAGEGQVEGGVEALRQAIEIDPSYPDVHFLLAGLLRRLGRLPEAIETYGRAIACHAAYLDAHVELGQCQIEAGRLDEAARTLGRALELKLDRIRLPFHRGLELLDGGLPAAAAECFHEAFKAAPLLSGAHLEEALEWIRASEPERALDSLERALSLNPKYPDLHNYRGIVLCELERFDEALAAFRRSAELAPGHVVPQLNLAFALLRAGRVGEGETELEAILERDPGQPVALARLEELRASQASQNADRRGAGARP